MNEVLKIQKRWDETYEVGNDGVVVVGGREMSYSEKILVKVETYVS